MAADLTQRKVKNNLQASDKISSWDLSERRQTSLRIFIAKCHEMLVAQNTWQKPHEQRRELRLFVWVLGQLMSQDIRPL
jgi:hypothetical protein